MARAATATGFDVLVLLAQSRHTRLTSIRLSVVAFAVALREKTKLSGSNHAIGYGLLWAILAP